MKGNGQLCHAKIINPADAKFWEDDVEEEKNVESVPNMLHEFITAWDCDGIGRIYMARSAFRRIIWIILWVILFGFGSYQCFTTFQAFQKHDKTVTIGKIGQASVEFPAVTFCTLTPFSPQSEDWYKNNSHWSSFLVFQNDYTQQATPGNCAANVSFADQPSVQDNTTEIYNITDDDATLNNYSDLSLPTGSFDSDGGTTRRRRSISLTSHSGVELLNTRINCSLVYQRLLYEYNLENGIDQPGILKIGDTSNCRELGNFTNKEKLFPDAICWIPTIRDAYGYYTTDTYECNPLLMSKFNSTANQICSTCCSNYDDNSYTCLPETDYKEQLQYTNEFIPSDETLLNLVKKSKTTDGSDLNGKFTVSPSDIEDSATPINKVILTCSFDQQKCSIKDFQQWNSERYGRCYTFNSIFQFNNSNITSTNNKPKQTILSGPKNGLRLTLDINSNNILDLLSPEIGLRVVFHKPDTIPIPEDEGINVLPGVSTSIQLTMQEIKRIEPPCGKCAKVDWKPQFNYTRNACQKLCLEQLYRSQCNCFVGLSPAYSNLTKPANLSQCSVFNYTQKFCMDNVIFSYYNGDIKCDCPQSCYEWSYASTLTSSVPNMKYYKIVQAIKGVNLGDDICTGYGNSTIRMQVYLKSLTIDLLEEKEAYTIETLVANIGGSMGLFLGVSIISCLELLEFFFNFALYFFKKASCYKKQTTNTKRSHVYIIHEKIGKHALTSPGASLDPMLLTSLDAYNHNRGDNTENE